MAPNGETVDVSGIADDVYKAYRLGSKLMSLTV